MLWLRKSLTLAGLVRARPPGLEAPLEPLQGEGHQHAGPGDEHEPCEHLRALERGARNEHHLPHPELRRDRFAHDYARQGMTDPEAEAGEDERNRPRKSDRPEELQIRRAERSRDFDQVHIEIPY